MLAIMQFHRFLSVPISFSNSNIQSLTPNSIFLLLLIDRLPKNDGPVKSPKTVTPAKAGVQNYLK